MNPMDPQWAIFLALLWIGYYVNRIANDVRAIRYSKNYEHGIDPSGEHSAEPTVLSVRVVGGHLDR